MAPLVTKRLINTEEYYKMGETGVFRPDEKIELINGEIINMAPIGSNHAAIVRQLSSILARSFTDEIIISSQQPIHIDQWNEPEPDIALLKLSKDNYFEAHPGPSDVLMIVEVSDSSHDYDSKVKLPLYASAVIPVYWIINLNRKCIEVYEEPVDDLYQKRMLYIPGHQISFMDKSFDVAEILLV
ncbi:Uma2 family endonuclease [Membranicola marinus]|uniref:Uma2 family endonuclease n=1 Tax=Membranihabitans marinus TaxID=1227546 RepID=A0A953I089_9BACT|nr:Uma2 family endonuclease [Membranihabitans marinus]MBY5958907.1 Uma2 family endonuclease [Membranihabitans marinus]